jgi:hypothetical protein
MVTSLGSVRAVERRRLAVLGWLVGLVVAMTLGTAASAAAAA